MESPAGVGDRQEERGVVVAQFDCRARIDAGVLVDILQRFLDDAKDRQFLLGCERGQRLVDLQLNTLGKEAIIVFDVPSQRRRQTVILQHGRSEIEHEPANLDNAVLEQLTNTRQFFGHLIGRASRDLALPLIYFGGGLMRWSPDGRYLLVRGKFIDGYFGFHRVDVANGETVTLVREPGRGEETGLGNSPGWGADGRSIIWANDPGISERSLATGEDRVLVRGGPADPITAVIPSGSGRLAAFSQTLSVGRNPIQRVAVRAEDGTIRELVRKPGGRLLLVAEWTPGDDAVIYAENVGAAGWRLSRVPAAGGDPIDMKITIAPGRLRLTRHPDGRSLTYASGTSQFEIWVMRGIAR